MTTANRETYRKKFAELLENNLVGTGKPAAAVYAYLVADFGGLSPIVCIGSAGTEAEQRAVSSRRKNGFYFNVYTFANFSTGESDVEDRTDLLEKSIREVIAANVSTDNWAFIEIAGRSETSNVLVSGKEYRMEVIPVRMTVYDN